MPAKRIILFPQDKGGIGKSFVATLLHDYYVDAGLRVRAFDLDHANSTFFRLVPGTEFINTDVDADKLGILDRIVHALPEADIVLADNRASGGSKILTYLDETRLPELQEELNCAIVFVVIATDDKDANSQIAELLDSHGRRVRWLVARNLREGESLDLFAQSKARQRLQTANLTVGRGRSADELHLLDRSRCIRFHARMQEEFGKAGALLIP